jgi:hypothetical protein
MEKERDAMDRLRTSPLETATLHAYVLTRLALQIIEPPPHSLARHRELKEQHGEAPASAVALDRELGGHLAEMLLAVTEPGKEQ